MDNVKILIKEGLADRIAFGNDGGAIQLPGCSKEMEFEMLKKCYSDLNIPTKTANKDILRIFTLNSAKSLKIDSRFGSIGNGKAADLVIYKENPLENINVIKGKVDGLFMNGQRIM
jgi:predicted amidohydrolase YtcJ